jgi:hypothetical protein
MTIPNANNITNKNDAVINPATTEGQTAIINAIISGAGASSADIATEAKQDVQITNQETIIASIDAQSAQLSSVDFATETTLEALQLQVSSTDFATEATQANLNLEATQISVLASIDAFATIGSSSSMGGATIRPLATEVTANLIRGKTIEVRDKLVHDGVTNAIRVIDYAHHEAHAGSHYFASYCVPAVGSGEQVSMNISVPAGGSSSSGGALNSPRAHMVVKIATSGHTRYRILENGTFTSSSTLITAYNNDRDSLSESVLTLTDAGPIDGEMIWDEYFGVVSGQGVNTTQLGGGSRGDQEVILATAGDYTILVDNADTGDNPMDVSISLSWYEHQAIVNPNA